MVNVTYNWKPIRTCIVRPIRKSVIQLSKGSSAPSCLSSSIGIVCETTSKALAKSNRTTSKTNPASNQRVNRYRPKEAGHPQFDPV